MAAAESLDRSGCAAGSKLRNAARKSPAEASGSTGTAAPAPAPLLWALSLLGPWLLLPLPAAAWPQHEPPPECAAAVAVAAAPVRGFLLARAPPSPSSSAPVRRPAVGDEPEAAAAAAAAAAATRPGTAAGMTPRACKALTKRRLRMNWECTWRRDMGRERGGREGGMHMEEGWKRSRAGEMHVC